ncbi:MAG: LysR family transcriptional regulator [marine bacterium B5-7]|nr:MAG: LysR family transcriptional regulator [marine bacterium B5-7]
MNDNNSDIRADDPGRSAEAFVRNLDWNLLRTFMVIVEARGITSAASELGLKQPSVSNALRRLEKHTGTQLIERGSNRFRVTGAGKTLYRECVEIHGTVIRLADELKGVTDEINEHVQLAMASHVSSPLLNETLSRFHKDHPKATLSIDIHSSRDVIERVVHRSVSFAVCLIDKMNSRLEYRRLYREYFGLYCGPSHPLFGRKRLTLADLAGEASVSFSTDQFTDVLRPVAMMRARAGLDGRVVGISSNLEEVRRMIVSGLGIGPLPVHVMTRDVRDGLLWRLPPYDELPAIDVYVAYNPKTRFNRAEAKLLELLLESIESTPMAERTYSS